MPVANAKNKYQNYSRLSFWMMLLAVAGSITLIAQGRVSAHAGVQKSNSDYIVTYYQTPVSPLTGEKVKMTFAVSDHDLNSQKGVAGKYNLIDTLQGDESKDKLILEKGFKTDDNGAFEFEYTFEKENYFTIALAFDDKPAREQHIDFLIQVRNNQVIKSHASDQAKAQTSAGPGLVLPMIAAFTAGAIPSILLLLRKKHL